MRRVSAAARVRAATVKLGEARFELVRLVLRDAPWPALARRMGVTAEEAEALAADAIERLIGEG